MTLDERAHQALELDKLNLPPRPPVVGIDVEPEVDTSGEDALRVYVIVRDDITDDDIRGEDMLQIKREIHKRLQNHDIHLFPYMSLRTESERREELAEGRESRNAQ